ncbi:TlpA family protein disulfide reductase [Streptomyces sp. 4N509B]|uniref:TlpA family protein disulfide reductase n=1 Tax=Streptomyces sp. 4N509B TaxID=3457413 RepID=UPI003FD23CF4
MIQNRAKLATAAGSLVLLAAGLTACSGDQAGPSGGDTQIVQGTGEITTVPVADREQAPELTGESLDGGQLSLSDYRGEVVVLNIWGSWCAPCRAEAPHLVAVAEETADQGVQFLGINTRDRDRTPALTFEEDYGIGFPSFYDPSGRLLLEFPSGSLNPQAIPTTIVVDREGRIAARALLALTDDELRSIIEPIVAEGAGDAAAAGNAETSGSAGTTENENAES